MTTLNLEDIEVLAVELAQLAGAEITASLGRQIAIRYKSLSENPEELYRDPVSEIDHSVEVLIRARLADKYPEHDIIGEEIDERPGRDHDVVWAIDPVDGTANFVNGFPLFAASIGVIDKGIPVAGAVWCSTSHRLRPGVYHARQGGKLAFDGEPLEHPRSALVKRRLIGLPRAQGLRESGFEARHTGSAAIECAFVAAGLLAAARFDRPNLWDVAGGLPLVQAAAGEIRAGRFGGGEKDWEDFEGFHPGPDAGSDISLWRRPLLIGDPAAVRALSAARPG